MNTSEKQKKFDSMIKKTLAKWVFSHITVETLGKIRSNLKQSIDTLNNSSEFKASVGDVIFNSDEGLVVYAQYMDHEGTHSATYSLKPSVNYVLVPEQKSDSGKSLVLG